MFCDQREFLDSLERRRLSVPIRVSRGDNDLMALSRHLSLEDGPCVWLENCKGFNTPDIPVLIGNIGTRRRL